MRWPTGGAWIPGPSPRSGRSWRTGPHPLRANRRTWSSARPERAGCATDAAVEGLRGWLGGRWIGLPQAELISLGILAGGKPPHVRHRHGLAGLPPQLLHPLRPGVDVVDVEVGADPPL